MPNGVKVVKGEGRGLAKADMFLEVAGVLTVGVQVGKSDAVQIIEPMRLRDALQGARAAIPVGAASGVETDLRTLRCDRVRLEKTERTSRWESRWGDVDSGFSASSVWLPHRKQTTDDDVLSCGSCELPGCSGWMNGVM